MRTICIDLELGENPSIEEAKAYIDRFGPSLAIPAPDHVIELLGGTEKIAAKLAIIQAEINRLTILYPELGE